MFIKTLVVEQRSYGKACASVNFSSIAPCAVGLYVHRNAAVDPAVIVESGVCYSVLGNPS